MRAGKACARTCNRFWVRQFSQPPGDPAQLHVLLADYEKRVLAEQELRKLAELRFLAAEQRTYLAKQRAYLAEQWTFDTQFRAVSARSSAATTSNFDRRGTPRSIVSSIDDVFAGIPPATDGGVATSHMWAAFVASQQKEWTPPKSTVIDENRDTHPTLARLFDAAMPSHLRLWKGVVARDDILSHAEFRPDLAATSARDSAYSTFGAVVIADVKPLGDIVSAVNQVCSYLRRRVYKLWRECVDQGENGDWVFALGVATDGNSVVFIRVGSGAPHAGGSFADAVPFPTIVTSAMPLLEWDFRSPNGYMLPLGASPPEGFSALVRLFNAPVDRLGDGAPLDSLCASVRWVDTIQGVAGPESLERLQFGTRLGCGGSSDAYLCEGTSVLSVTGDGLSEPMTRDGSAILPVEELLQGSSLPSHSGLVVKVARTATDEVTRSFAAEQAALLKLRASAALGLVPTLLGIGSRTGTGTHDRSADVSDSGHEPERLRPLLLLQPHGLPVATWVDGRVSAALARLPPSTPASVALASAAAVRRVCARTVVLRVLHALASAHAEGIAHCDVRPANFVIEGDAAVLIDWGSSCALGSNAKNSGVPAYAAIGVFWRATCVAHPSLDVAGALYSWLSIAFGPECVAPWFDPKRDDDAMYEMRYRWITKHSSTDASVAAVAVILNMDTTFSTGAAPTSMFSAALALPVLSSESS